MLVQFYSKNQRTSGIKVGAAVSSLVVVIQLKARRACQDKSSLWASIKVAPPALFPASERAAAVMFSSTQFSRTLRPKTKCTI